MLRFIWGSVVVGLIVLEMCLNVMTTVGRTATAGRVEHASVTSDVLR